MCVRLIPERRRIGSSAFDPFPCALLVVGLVRVRSARSHTPLGSFRCVGSIPTRHYDRRVRSCAFKFVLGVVGFVRCVKSIPVRPGDRRVRWCTLGPLPCSQGGVRFRSVRVWSIPVHPGVLSCAFGPFPCFLGMEG